MSMFCPNKVCKAVKGACSHEKWMASAIIIAIGIFALGKMLKWF